ncbi:zinc metalloproteinase-disintegrin-like berythractivase isoform X2 [Amia ocellicauda]|uniref:zinc metalloproteinase-disintegrin-like berythractivase isoform X2 n=1 Tax=Amia ocellicauda TaxID=2972642 RepID=UPI003463D24E
MRSTAVLLWIVTLSNLIHTSVGHRSVLEGVERYEVVRPRSLHTLHKRETKASRPDIAKYSIQVGGREIVMALEKNEGLLTKDYTETHYTDDGQKMTTAPADLDHCYYHGHIQNDSDSAVSISTCDGLRGYFKTAGQQYLIEPLSKDDTGEHAVVKYESVEQGPAVCGVTNTTWDEDYPVVSKVRSRTSGPSLMKQDKYMELYLVADNREYVKMRRNLNDLRKRVFEIINFSNMVYRPLKTFLALTGLEVWTDQDKFVVEAAAGNTLGKFTDWGKANLQDKRHDNAQLLTAIDFEGPTVGLAYIGTLCSDQSTGIIQDHSNSAIAVGATISHEMGHNLGMNHDTSSCICVDSSCIMAAALSYDTPRHFSSCSDTSYEKFLNERNPECLLDKPAKEAIITDPVCGNSFIEKGEECDCGIVQECTNPCCNATTCTLTKGSACADGECCKDCKILSTDRECRRQKDDCDLPEYCDGKSPQCPEDVFTVNGQPCSNGNGYCYNGLCPLFTEQCIRQWGPAATVADETCYSQNTRGVYYAFCKRTDNTYIGCQRKDMKCGKLFCSGGTYDPKVGRMVQFQNCKASFFSTAASDQGQVAMGTKCGDAQVCSDNECVDLETAYKSTNCSAKCKGHAVCNHKLECQCEPGWSLPDCDHRIEAGGKLSPGAIAAIVILIFLVVLIVVITVVIVLKRKRDRRLRPPSYLKTPGVTNPNFAGQRQQEDRLQGYSPYPVRAAPPPPPRTAAASAPPLPKVALKPHPPPMPPAKPGQSPANFRAALKPVNSPRV